MSVVSARRYGAVVVVYVLIGALSVVLPSLTQASTASPTSSHTARTAQSHQPAPTGRFRMTHVRVELVRNGGFHNGKAHWAKGGAAKPRLRIVNPGQHSRHAARLTGSRRGFGAVTEHLAMTPTAKGNRYVASASVRSARSRSKVELRLYEVNKGTVVGVTGRRALVRRHHGWRELGIRYTARQTGSRLVLVIGSRSLRPKRGFVVDNARVVERVKMVPRTPGQPDPSPTVPAPVSSPPSGGGTPVRCGTLSATDVPSCGVLWGAYKPPGTGQTLATTVTDLESQVGRPFDIVYRYHDWGSASSGSFPDKYEQQLAASGHILMVDWETQVFSAGHQQIQWSAIAAGKYDSSVIDPEAKRIKAFGSPIFISVDAEMDAMVGTNGSAADYVAAFRHIHDEFAKLGVTNAIWVFTTEAWSAHWNLDLTLYPGSNYIDWVGFDAYNFASCHSEDWRSFSETVTPAYDFFEANGLGNKPFMLPEYGTAPDPNNSSATSTWYSQIPSALSALPNIKAMLEWDDDSTCNATLTADPGELQSFATAGLSSQVDTFAN
jgi:Glycosyl hydrolase family 26